MVDARREAVASASRTAGRAFVFTGRSPRTEVAFYWLVSALVTGVLSAAAKSALEWDAAIVARSVITFVVAIPFVALFARRLHDQDRSGWWALVLLPLVAADLYQTIRVNFHAFDPGWSGLGYWQIPLLVMALVSFAVIAMPGTEGPNRHGPDPRIADHAAAV